MQSSLGIVGQYAQFPRSRTQTRRCTARFTILMSAVYRLIPKSAESLRIIVQVTIPRRYDDKSTSYVRVQYLQPRTRRASLLISTTNHSSHRGEISRPHQARQHGTWLHLLAGEPSGIQIILHHSKVTSSLHEFDKHVWKEVWRPEL